jgi:hypothetical protein
MVKRAASRVHVYELLSAGDRGRPLSCSRRPGLPPKTFAAKLDALLGRLQKERQMPTATAAKPSQMREGVTLAVRLAELIQTAESARQR